MITIPTGLNAVRTTYGDERPYRGIDGRLRPEWEEHILKRIIPPAPMVLSWDRTVPVKAIRMHFLIADEMQAFLQEVLDAKRWTYIDRWSGGYADRAQRGAHKPSLHAFGIAFDVDPDRNKMGSDTWRMHPDVVDIAAKHGFYWGGRFAAPRNDPMHYQAARGA